MTSLSAKPGRNVLGRRDLCKASAVAAAGALTGSLRTRPASAQTVGVEAQEHWVNKGPVKLYLYRKRQAASGAAARPVLFLVHGSTFSSRGSFNLVVPGRAGYSAVDSLRRARLRRVDHGPRGLWLLLTHVRQFRYPGRCRGPQGRATACRAGDRQGVRLHVRRVLGRHPRGRLSPWLSPNASSGSFCTPSPTPARTRPT